MLIGVTCQQSRLAALTAESLSAAWEPASLKSLTRYPVYTQVLNPLAGMLCTTRFFSFPPLFLVILIQIQNNIYFTLRFLIAFSFPLLGSNPLSSARLILFYLLTFNEEIQPHDLNMEPLPQVLRLQEMNPACRSLEVDPLFFQSPEKKQPGCHCESLERPWASCSASRANCWPRELETGGSPCVA